MWLKKFLRRGNRQVAIVILTPLILIGGAAGAFAATGSSTVVAKASNLYGCVGVNRAITGVYTNAQNFKGCATGFAITVASGVNGTDGTNGSPGQDGASYEPVTATATTSISNDSDSGNHGNWATDTLTRSMTVDRHSAVAVSNCGGDSSNGITTCWYYTASMTDTGSFITVDGADSPQAGVAISGTLAGNISGGSDYEFYASSGTPTSADVPGMLDASVNGTDSSHWVERFFPDSTSFGDVNEINWDYSYTAGATCEQWTDAYNNSDGSLPADGDITGINACS